VTLQCEQPEQTSVSESAKTVRFENGEPGHGTSPGAMTHAEKPEGALPAHTEAALEPDTEHVCTAVSLVNVVLPTG
jgi:hypothetical protein